MMVHFFMLLIMLQSVATCFSFTISKTPLCSVYTPDSILERKNQYHSLPVGNRQRYSTCTGAVWFHDSYLAVLNLFGRKIITYYFDPEQKIFTELQEINNQNGTVSRHPENVTVSPDGRLLTVCSDNPQPEVTLYSLNLETHTIDPEPILVLSAKNLVHNVAFSPDGSYLASACFDNNTSINIYQVSGQASNLTSNSTYTKSNDHTLLKAKALCFSTDGSHLIVAYSLALPDTKKHPLESLIVAYPFNKESGTLDEPVCTVQQSLCIEDIVLVDNGTTLLASNQHNDTVVKYSFDQNTGHIDKETIFLKNPEAQLSFPHGLALSPDGNYLVVTNYGDDKFNLYQIK